MMPFATNNKKRRAPSGNKEVEQACSDRCRSRIPRSGSRFLRFIGSKGGRSSLAPSEKVTPLAEDTTELSFLFEATPRASHFSCSTLSTSPPEVTQSRGSGTETQSCNIIQRPLDGSTEHELEDEVCSRGRPCHRIEVAPHSYQSSPFGPELQPINPSSRLGRITIPSHVYLGSSSPLTASPSTQNSASPLNAHDSSPPSSVISSNLSPRSKSSIVYHSPTRRPDTGRGALTPIIEVPSSNDLSRVSTPETRPALSKLGSIALAEKVAAVKVYFETRYASPELGPVSARELRRGKLESDLGQMMVAEDVKQHCRKRFFAAESNHLRLLRVMKSRHLNDVKGISAVGFEAVRILGKGSFGVVRLVREREPSDLTAGVEQLIQTRHIGPSHMQQDQHTDNDQKSWNRAIASRPVYAMKVIRKSEMLRNSQEAHLRAERDFLVSCAAKAKWVVPLIASFQDANNLYLILEFEIGGDFLGYLLRRGTLKESAAKFYVAEMVLCVEEIHKMKWIHRDIKPDNFLIASSGHLKISDFGLAFDGHWAHNQAYYHEHRFALLDQFGVTVEGDSKDKEDDAKASSSKKQNQTSNFNEHSINSDSRFKRRKLARSIVGTSQYMAPEVIRGVCYDGRCDWWSIGIILYECLWGYTPFSRDDRESTKAAILNHEKCFTFDQTRNPVSLYAQDIIYRLLQEPELRLCSDKYRRNDFVGHMSFDCMPFDGYSHSDMIERSAMSDRSRYHSNWVKPANRDSHDYEGRHVYQNDADDIKRHPFFADIPWEHLHEKRPPFVPKVTSKESTKYFDSEAEILGSSAENMVSAAEHDTTKDLKPRKYGQMAELVDGMQSTQLLNAEKANQKKQMKKRPRCKLLRDPITAQTVMEVRKKSAFLGYTYRRPRTWSMGDELRLATDIF